MTYTDSQPFVILFADDDEDDQKIIQHAFTECRLRNDLYFTNDGEELLDYLYLKGTYNINNAPRPDLILLDLNMPKKDGREALKEIKSDPHLKKIPIIVLTTSRADEDILNTYKLGANSYITKPTGLDGMINLIRDLGNYWLKVVKLPPNKGAHLD
jgi:CheY-like chemotaxis protein